MIMVTAVLAVVLIAMMVGMLMMGLVVTVVSAFYLKLARRG